MKTIIFSLVAAAVCAAQTVPQSLLEAMDPVLYRIEGHGPVFRAENRANRLAAEFQGAQTMLRIGSAELELRVSGYGWGSSLASPGGVVKSDARGQRLERRYASGLREWFENGRQGLEQGFVVDGRGGSGGLHIRLTANHGWRVAGGGGSVTFTRDSAKLDYGGVKAIDARGVEQLSRLRAVPDGVEIEVDDAGAVYPLTIDPTFTQQAKLTASDAANGDGFGLAAALAGDGNTALVTSYSKTVSKKTAQGAAYVFTRNGATWSQQAELTASDGAEGDYFGGSAALSSDGNTALIGAYFKTVSGNTYQGAAYVFTRSGSTWSQQAELTANDGASGDYFGTSAALSSDGNTALLGAKWKAISSNSGQGAAYVFTRSDSTWSQQSELTANDGAKNDGFGYSVALASDGNTALVAAIYKKVSANYQQGAAYVFTRAGNTWSQRQELTASDGVAWDAFGESAALSGDGNTALLGACQQLNDKGAAYVFTRSGDTWSQQQELTASDGAAFDIFGWSAALSNDGNTALVGAEEKTISANAQGAAYVYTRSGTTWSQQQELTASDAAYHDYFGTAVGLASDGNTALVGAGSSGLASAGPGKSYVFAAPTTPMVNVTVATSPAGLQVTVGGSTVTAPNTTSQAVGFLLGLGTPSPQSLNGTQYVFSHWEDSSTSAARNVSVPSSDITYTATFTALAAPGISKGFNPASIASGGSSVVTLTLTNGNASALGGGSLTDTLVNMSAAGGAVGGTCSGTTPSSLTVGQTALSFSGIAIPASGSCTVTFSVTSSHPGNNSNTASGVTTAQTATAGAASNTAILTVSSQTTVTNVTSSTANGRYKAGAAVSIQVSFSAAVNVTGTPQLALNSGGTAFYASGSASNTLSFTYTVAGGQNSAHLDYASSSALSANGGTVTDAGSNAAVLTLPAPGAAGSLGANKNIAIDTVAPTVISYSVLFGSKSFNMSGSTRNRLPWAITGIQVVFSEPVIATAAGLSGLAATGVSGSGTTTVTWSLSPVTKLASTVTKILGTTGYAVTDLAGNALGGGTDFSQMLKVLYADFNDDGVVNAQDLAAVNAAHSQSYNILADLNGDNAVDINDVSVVRAQIGNTNP